jgi:protein phosphatase
MFKLMYVKGELHIYHFGKAGNRRIMKTFSMTDRGKARQMNQDYVFTSDTPIGQLPNLFIVADGMGGHNAGDYASKYAVNRIVEELENQTEAAKACEEMEKAIAAANTALYKQAQTDDDKQGMGTTVVACTIMEDHHMYVANVGDSRLYVVGEEITQITKDHSYVQDLVSKGEIASEAARSHPKKNIITRAVGVSGQIKVDFFDVQLKDNDGVLLCSDGLTNMLEDTDIIRVIRGQRDIVEKVEKLVEAANEAGGTDNISVILIEPDA